jgi:hypothetical protein
LLAAETGNWAMKSASGLALSSRPAEIVADRAGGIAGREHVAPERLAGKEHSAREPERRIEPALERRLEAGDVDAELLEQALGDTAVEGLGRLHRLAATVADDQALTEAKLVALGMPAEIVVVVEDEDARRAVGAPIEPGRRQPADPAADYDQVVALLDRHTVEGEGLAIAQLMADLERARMMAAHPRERGRIARGLRHDLRHGRKPGRDRERRAVEKIAARDVGHAFNSIGCVMASSGCPRQG